MKLKLVKNNSTIIDFGDFKSENEVKVAMYNFLKDPVTKGKYKVEPYQTIHFMKDDKGKNKKKIVDFGDYSYFLEVEY